MAERKSESQKARLRTMQKAHDLYVHEQMSFADIAVELNVTPQTASKYAKKMGATVVIGKREKPEEFDPMQKFLNDAASGKIEELNPSEKPTQEETYHARKNEEANIVENANRSMTAAEKYQAYIAGQGMRMMRDALPHLKKPTNVKELEILDTVIRRNLGLGGKGTGGKVKIDVNILNNSKASPNGAVVDID